jgi:ATP-dependent RNA helicase DDX5/DBP2
MFYIDRYAYPITSNRRLPGPGHARGQGKRLVLYHFLLGSDSTPCVPYLPARTWRLLPRVILQSQEERDWALREFKNMQSTLLVATDVAARGLDVDDIRMVVNFDFPKEMESYIHRIGRTGRAGKKGTAVSFFVPEKNARMARDLVDILQRTAQNIPPQLQALSSFSGGGGGGGRGRGRGGRRY